MHPTGSWAGLGQAGWEGPRWPSTGSILVLALLSKWSVILQSLSPQQVHLNFLTWRLGSNRAPGAHGQRARGLRAAAFPRPPRGTAWAGRRPGAPGRREGRAAGAAPILREARSLAPPACGGLGRPLRARSARAWGVGAGSRVGAPTPAGACVSTAPQGVQEVRAQVTGH